MTLKNQKMEFLEHFHQALKSPVSKIATKSVSHQAKAKLVNKLIAAEHATLVNATTFPIDDSAKQQALLILQYCTSVISLEYRHEVWPYEYMALSRRVGELWERFCRAAWDHPSLPNVQRMDAPLFPDVARKIRARIESYISADVRKSASVDLNTVFDLIGEINMREDEMFLSNGRPHVIDFKSGFGSNEKGNTLRLLTVGRAYKLWNPNTRLLLLVRQEQNNNYLNVIERSGLWEVFCGDAAYKEIDMLTGSNTNAMRGGMIDFKSDLSDDFWSDLSSHLTDLTSYLEW